MLSVAERASVLGVRECISMYVIARLHRLHLDEEYFIFNK